MLFFHPPARTLDSETKKNVILKSATDESQMEAGENNNEANL